MNQLRKSESTDSLLPNLLLYPVLDVGRGGPDEGGHEGGHNGGHWGGHGEHEGAGGDDQSQTDTDSQSGTRISSRRSEKGI